MTNIGAVFAGSVAGILMLVAADARASTTTLYTATSGLPPELPQWFESSSGGTPSISVVNSNYLDFSTSSTTLVQAAFLLLSPAQTLNAASGYDLSFRLQIATESHTSTNRGGFSFIVIGSNTAQSLELTFWTNDVWAYTYNSGFVHGPDFALDTTVVHDYTLQVLNTNFTLFVDGTAVLSGPLQDYLAPTAPYQDPNTIIFGDDTTEASADVHLFNVKFITNVIPEPSPFQFTSIVLTNAHDLLITWNTTGVSNIVQVTAGTGTNGSFSTNGFTDLTTIVVTTYTTNFWDVGAATNHPARYYRIRSPQ
jgi:hypothetical protein